MILLKNLSPQEPYAIADIELCIEALRSCRGSIFDPDLKESSHIFATYRVIVVADEYVSIASEFPADRAFDEFFFARG